MKIKTLIGLRYERKKYIDNNLKLEDAPICDNPQRFCICKGYNIDGPIKCLYKERNVGCMIEINQESNN